MAAPLRRRTITYDKLTDDGRINVAIVNALKIFLTTYLKTERLEMYSEGTVIKDLLFFIGRSIDKAKKINKCDDRKGYMLFVLDVLKIMEEEFSIEEREEALEIITKRKQRETERIEKRSW